MAQLPDRVVGTYWFHVSGLRLNTLHTGYNVVWIAFADPTGQLNGGVYFDANAKPDKATFKADMAELRARANPPKIILSSFGGVQNRQVVNSNATADRFAADIIAICADYGFDGFDWDLEHAADFTAPALERATRAIKQAMGDEFIITAAPHLSPNLTMWSWNNNGRVYADWTRRCKDIIDLVSPQYYNRGPTFNGQQVYQAGVWSTSHLVQQTREWIELGQLRQDQIGMLFMFNSPVAVSDSELTTHANANAIWNAVTAVYPDVRGMGTWSMTLDEANAWAFATDVGPNVLDNGPLLNPPDGGTEPESTGQHGVLDNFNVSPGAPPVQDTQGAVDDFNVVPAGALPPSAPVSFVAQAGDGSALVTWQAPATGEVTGYQIVASSGSLQRTYLFSAAAQNGVLGRLTNDSIWTLALTALGDQGDSPAVVISVTPSETAGDLGGVDPQPAPPDAPELSTATAGVASAHLTWTAPVYDGGSPVLNYRVTGLSSSGVVSIEPGPDALQATIEDLTNDVAYSFTVAAVNAHGTSSASSALTVTPSAGATPLLPEAVTGLTADPLNGGALLSWTPGSFGVGDFEAYVITAVSDYGETLPYLSTSEVATVQLAGMENDRTWTISVAVRTTVGESTTTDATVVPTDADPIPVAPLSPVIDQPDIEVPPPYAPPPTPRFRLMIEAFPPGAIFAPRNFGQNTAQDQEVTA